MLKHAPRIETSRLSLREQAVRDFEAYATMWADPRVTAFIGGEPRTRTVAWQRFGQGSGMWPLLGMGAWTVERKDDRAYLGTIMLANFERCMPELEGVPEAGWAFAAAAWGQGIASEALAAILNWSDQAIDSDEIRCIIDPDNAASIQVAEKCGFVCQGRVSGPAGASFLFARQRCHG